MRIFHEAIYQYVYSQLHRNGNGTSKKGCEDLRICLLRKRKRRIKKDFRQAQKFEITISLPSIDARPNIVDKRKRIGGWEDDCLVSKKSKVCIKSTN